MESIIVGIDVSKDRLYMPMRNVNDVLFGAPS